jgi:hypothetical protein
MFPTRAGRMNRVVAGALALLALAATVSVVMLRNANSELERKEQLAVSCHKGSEALSSKLHGG